jgi:methionyl-tRNA formyltransferase
MRVLFMGNGWVGWQVVDWLRQQPQAELVGLVVHPPHKQRYVDEIITAASIDPKKVFDGSTLSQPETIEAIAGLRPELGLSIYFGYILSPGFISLFKDGVINLHPSYLPYNRGANPNIWSIVDQTPAGVSLHYLDSGIDTGDIIARQQVTVESVDTGKTLYQKLEQTSLELFKETWPLIQSSQVPHFPQSSQSGTCHRTRDVENIDLIDLDKQYTARKLINILRARTFPPYAGAYFMYNGRKVYLRLQLFYEEQLEEKVE